MKNVTISMDEATLRLARVAAAREGKSLSRYVADMLGRHVASEGGALAERFLATPLSASSGGPLPPRAVRHDD